MKDLLAPLREMRDVRGCAVMTHDGMLVVGSLPPDSPEEVVAALTSFMVTTTNRSLRENGLENFESMMLTATNGNLLLISIGQSYLVTITDQFVDARELWEVARQTAQAVREAGKLSV